MNPDQAVCAILMALLEYSPFELQYIPEFQSDELWELFREYYPHTANFTRAFFWQIEYFSGAFSVVALAGNGSSYAFTLQFHYDELSHKDSQTARYMEAAIRTAIRADRSKRFRQSGELSIAEKLRLLLPRASMFDAYR